MNKLSLLILTVIIFLKATPFTMAQSIFINEISICNISKEMDPNFNYSGWIELYNTSEKDINLQKLYYSDEQGKPLKYKLITLRTLPTKGYASIWINDEISDGGANSLDTDPDGGYLSISDEKGNILDAITYPIQRTNISWGRTTDGGSTFGYFLKSTHDYSNNGSATASTVVAEPTFSQKGGFYSAPVSVSIQCKTEEAKIFYTLDGSYPTPKKNLYTGTPIQIDSTTPLRAKAYAEGYLEGTIATATYMINERVPDLPVFFITTDSVNLYNDTIGIYCIGTNGVKVTSSNIIANYYRDWTRPAHLEFLDKNKNNCLDQSIGLSINGNATRRFDQKSLKINSGKKYGKSRFDYPLFCEKEACRIKSFLLRNGGQNNGPEFFRDGLLQTMTSIVGEDHQAFETAVVYVNGTYWGMLNIREVNNKDFVYSNYGYSENEIDIIEYNWREMADCGDMIEYNKMKEYITNTDLANDSLYEHVKQLIDVDSYIYYMAVEIYISNVDWPNNNQKLFRNKNNGKFRWILQDLDKGFSSDTGDKFKLLLDSKDSTFPFKMIIYLLKNEEFKERFIDAECLVAGSLFNPIRGKYYLDSIQRKLDSEWQYHAERWGFAKAGSNTFHDAIAIHQQRFDALQASIYKNLADHFSLNEPMSLQILSNEPSAKLTFNSFEIPELPYDGMYYKDKILKLTAPEYVNGKKFQCWVIKKDKITSYEKGLNYSLTLNDYATSIMAFYDHSDSVRRSGLYINEISASNAVFVDAQYKYEDWIELYNASDKSIDIAGHFISNNKDNLELFQFKETDSLQTTIPANGHLIVWCSKNIERGFMHTNFKLDKEGGTLFLSKKSANESLEIIDSLSYFPHSAYSSFGRYPDGDASTYIFENPTFKSTNLATSYNNFKYKQDYNLVYGLDNLTQPIASDLLIDNGYSKTASLLVSISFKSNNTGTYYRLGESSNLEDATWKVLEKEITFTLSPELGTKTVYLQLRNARFESEVISDQIELVNNDHKVVVGFNGSNYKENITEIVNEEMLNNVSINFHDTFSTIQLYDIWGSPTMKLAKKMSEISKAMSKYGISERVDRYISSYNPTFTGDLGVYPNRFYSYPSFFGADSALTPETRRLIVGFINVPNGIYDIRILGSQNRKTDASDYLQYRYQANDSEIIIPDSDIFNNNQNNFIELKNVTVLDSTLLICSWREPFGVRWGYYAPMNLIEIKRSNLSSIDPIDGINNSNIKIISSFGKLIIEKNDTLPFSIYSIEGVIMKEIVPENYRTEIILPPGVYIIQGKKGIVF